MCPDGSCSPSSVLKVKNIRSHFEWYSFYLNFIIPSSGQAVMPLQMPRTAGAIGEQLLSLPRAARSGPGLQQWSDPAGCICARKAESIYVTFFAANADISVQYFALLFVFLGLQVTET